MGPMDAVSRQGRVAEKEPMPARDLPTLLDPEVEGEEKGGDSLRVSASNSPPVPRRAVILPAWLPSGDFSHSFSCRIPFLSIILLIRQEMVWYLAEFIHFPRPLLT